MLRSQPFESILDFTYERAFRAASTLESSFVRTAIRNVTAARRAVEEESEKDDVSSRWLRREPSDCWERTSAFVGLS